MLITVTSDIKEADDEIKELVEFVRPFVQSKKGVQYEKFEAIAYRSQASFAILHSSSFFFNKLQL